MPRILVATDTYPPQLNGVSVVTAGMLHGLTARGWECGVVAPAVPLTTKRLLWEPEPVRRFRLESLGLPMYPAVRVSWPAPSTVRRILDAANPDLVHCATEFLVGRAFALEARRRGLPVSTSYHTDFAAYCRAYRVPLLEPAVRAWLAYFHRAANSTLTPSKAAQGTLVELGVTGSHLWSGGVDVEQFHPRHATAAVRQRYGLEKAFTFVYVGRLAPEKKVQLVLEAFARLRRQRPALPLRLLVVGTGPSEVSLRSRSTAGVTFLGALDRRHDLPPLYASADAFVTASDTETLGLVVLEAMASGLPAITCDTGGVTECLEHGRNGLVFRRGDIEGCAAAMARLATDRSLHERLRAGARETAEAQSSVRQLDRLDELLRRVLTARVREPLPTRRFVVQPAP